ncbi:sensor histidine kinase [Haloarcula laminariae]|uniref:sensor histidine kinase n=1 Tax=Haloarcula laminariae TaxID=2961577 RepID=UPI002404C985|nr:HAMP domain-containing sensor histidine kinase [Halomicroarcula sp. FL173]
MGQRDDSQPNGADTVPIDALPDPVLGYELTDDGAAIVTTNAAFDAVFGTTSIRTPMNHWLHNETTADQEMIDDVYSSLTTDERVDITFEVHGDSVTPTEYRFRSLGGTGNVTGADGYIELTESQSTPNETIGAGHIASIISHDLRNPLDVANAHLRAARETGATEHFDELRNSHERMAQIIQDVLDLTRGEQSLDITANVDIETVATDAWKRVDTDDAFLRLADDLPTCQADSRRLQRLFENLFRNSVEHGQSGSVGMGDEQRDSDTQIHVSVGSTPDGFFVADDGTGIPATEHDRVFEPGYSLAETGHGTGLGLTIVEQIAQAHGWTVSLSNGLSGGSRFEFQLTSGDDTVA